MLVINMMHEIHGHMDSDDLERYSIGDMTESEAARVEEHLLVCEKCRGALEEAEAFAIAMKTATTEMERRRSGLRWKYPVLAAAACILLAAGVTMWRPAQPVIAVELTALRGNTVKSAPAGHALELHPDLTGLPSMAAYRVEIVDQAGRSVWRGELASPRNTVTAPGQSAGLYFVRVFSPAGELLREYGLPIGS